MRSFSVVLGSALFNGRVVRVFLKVLKIFEHYRLVGVSYMGLIRFLVLKLLLCRVRVRVVGGCSSVRTIEKILNDIIIAGTASF